MLIVLVFVFYGLNKMDKKYKETIICESCRITLEKHFEECPKCKSTAYHLTIKEVIEDE